jgi:hypothetical protein
MTIDERSRHELFTRLEEVLGPEPAATLMSHLPPVGWADVATKHDLDQLEQRLDARIGAVEQRLGARIDGLEIRMEALEHKLVATFRGELQTAITAQSRTLAITLAGTAAALSSLAFAAARFT